jgi:hypothetical protein
MVLMIVSNLKQRVPQFFYLIAVVSVFIIMRLPIVCLNSEINVDESSMITNALTLLRDPIYWRSVDGTTIGPLSIYLLIIPKIFGFQIDYTSTRIIGILCTIGSLLLFFYTIKIWFGNRTARISLLLPTIFLSFTQEPDFVHYSSEQLSVFLLNFCLFLVAFISSNKVVSYSSIYLLGFIAGILPFAKLQGLPQAFILILAGIFITYLNYTKTRKVYPILLIVLGGFSFPILAIAWMYSQGVFHYFIEYYLIGNINYAGNNKLLEIPLLLANVIRYSVDFFALLFVCIVIYAYGILKWQHKFQFPKLFKVQDVLVLFFAIYFLSAIYAVARTGRPFPHYLNFLLYPVCLMSAFGIYKKIDIGYNISALYGPFLLLSWFAIVDVFNIYRNGQLNIYNSQMNQSLTRSPVIETLKPYIVSSDYMVVWGWQSHYYVEAQLPQGTAQSNSERCIYEHPQRALYRQKYLNDMMRTRPAVFLDTVGESGKWLTDRATQGHEVFPELAKYISTQYKYVGEIANIRLYVRNDRMKKS